VDLGLWKTELELMWAIRSNTFRYTIYGALFGFMFPVFSTLGDVALQQLPLTLESLLQVQITTPLHWVIDTAPFFLGLFASLAGRRQDSLARLNEMLKQRIGEHDQAICQLESLQTGLEHQVAGRTADLARRSAQLEAAARVARGAAAVRDVELLLEETVHLISDHFGFYHAGIFLLDEAGEYAVLRAASSEGGQRMLARKHKLRVGKVGIVGYAAGTGRPRIALDVGEDSVFFNNPDLARTRSEMGLPLKVRERVIGVLDVQSTQEAAFSEEDVAVLEIMADQVALAIENAYFLEESQRALRELEALHGRRTRQAWQERAETHQPTAYRYTRAGVEAVSPALVPEPETQGLTEEQDADRLAVPIQLRGQSIGSIVLQQDTTEAHWSTDEIALVREVSTQIGLALENARLLEESQRRGQREYAIRRVTEQMQRAVGLENVLQSTVAQLGRVTGAPRVYVRLGTEAELGPDNGGGTDSQHDRLDHDSPHVSEEQEQPWSPSANVCGEADQV
jgi:GAF domain-containing protein